MGDTPRNGRSGIIDNLISKGALLLTALIALASFIGGWVIRAKQEWVQVGIDQQRIATIEKFIAEHRNFTDTMTGDFMIMKSTVAQDHETIEQQLPDLQRRLTRIEADTDALTRYFGLENRRLTPYKPNSSDRHHGQKSEQENNDQGTGSNSK